MACGDCGARKGHLPGCPAGDRDKRGGKGKPDPKQQGKRIRTPVCLATSAEDNPREHPDMRHVCVNDKGHSGSHTCGGCGKSY
jgi:hypothetical protein